MIIESTDSLISVPKAAVILGHSIPYTQRLIRSGNIKGQKLGRDWFTTEEAITLYVRGRRRSRRRAT